MRRRACRTRAECVELLRVIDVEVNVDLVFGGDVGQSRRVQDERGIEVSSSLYTVAPWCLPSATPLFHTV